MAMASGEWGTFSAGPPQRAALCFAMLWTSCGRGQRAGIFPGGSHDDENQGRAYSLLVAEDIVSHIGQNSRAEGQDNRAAAPVAENVCQRAEEN